MHRRRLLSTAGIALAGLLAGCSGDSSETDASTETAESGGTTGATTTAGVTTPSTTRPATGEPTAGEPTSQPITGQPTTSSSTPATTTDPRTETESGTTGTAIPDPQSTSTGDSASVSFENGGSRVVVTGTILGRDSCRRAVLDSTASNDGTLVVSIGTEREGGTDTLCAQVLTPVDYRFVLRPDSPPDSVRVVHDGTGDRRTVATVERTA